MFTGPLKKMTQPSYANLCAGKLLHDSSNLEISQNLAITS